MKPRFSAMQMAVRPNPVEAMLALRLFVIGPDIAPILYQSCLRIGLLPEEKEVSALQLIQKLVVGRGDGAQCGGRLLVRMLLLGLMLDALLGGEKPGPEGAGPAGREKCLPIGAAISGGSLSILRERWPF